LDRYDSSIDQSIQVYRRTRGRNHYGNDQKQQDRSAGHSSTRAPLICGPPPVWTMPDTLLPSCPTPGRAPPMTLDAVLSRIDETLPEAMERLFALLRIPSISTDPAFKADCARAADWLAEDLRGLGFDAAARPTPGHPMVVGHGGTGGRHLLFYGHYDVQPVDPLDLWHRAAS